MNELVADTASASSDSELPYLVQPVLRQRLDLIHHLLEFGNRVVVIQGASGSGRTRMLQAVCREADATWTVVRSECGSLGSTAAVLGTIADALNVSDPDGAAPVEEKIRRILARMESDRELCILAVDDAAELPEETLASLVRLAHEGDGEGRLRVLVTDEADAQLSERIDAMSSEPALAHRIEVPPLTIDQLPEFVRPYRGGGAAPLSSEQLEQVLNDSGGNPGRIIELLSASPKKGAASTDSSAANGLSIRHRALGAIIVAAVLAVVIATVLPMGSDAPRAPIAVTLPESQPVESSPREPVVVRTFDEPESQPQSEAPRDVTPIVSEPSFDDGALPSEPEVEAIASTAESEPPEAEVSEMAVPEPAQTEESQTFTASNEVPEPAAPEPDIAAPVATTEQPASPETVRELAPAPPIEKGPTAKIESYTAKWVLTQAPETYVIQLFGVREHDAAQRFLRQTPPPLPATTIELTLHDEPWYIVVLGHFPDRDTARAAIEQLPDTLSKFEPWARPVHSLSN